jgi:hypothetical protein
MSPRTFVVAASAAVTAAVNRFWVDAGLAIRDERIRRRWSLVALSVRAGVSRTVAYEVEAGRARSLEAVVRLASALGLRVEPELFDPRKRADRGVRTSDLVHSLMGEVESAHFRKLHFPTGIDEPYQHFQFAGRADFVAWDVAARALLHVENRTRFPDVQETAGSFNSKREYLGRALLDRAGVLRWASETHVIAGLWSAEVLHAMRRRPETFRSLSPHAPDAFTSWWEGRPPARGKTATVIVLDPLATGRQRLWIGLDEALSKARPRHHGYSDVVSTLRESV